MCVLSLLSHKNILFTLVRCVQRSKKEEKSFASKNIIKGRKIEDSNCILQGKPVLTEKTNPKQGTCSFVTKNSNLRLLTVHKLKYAVHCNLTSN